MAQHDYVIANGTGAAVRSDLNNGLAAIVSQNSGATAPATTYAYMTWADTTAGVMKMRNGANNAWITLYQLDGEWSTIAFENGSAAAPSIYFKDSGTDTGIYSPGADQVAISTGGTGRLFIDSSGRLLAGTSTARTNFFGTTLSAVIQTEGTGGSTGRGALSVINNDVSNNPPYVLLGRSGAATLGSNAVVVSGSRLGTVSFHGADGTSFIEAATVAGEVDGTPGTNDMPGRLVFSTTADGAASPTERLRITSAGNVGIGTSSPWSLISVGNSGTAGDVTSARQISVGINSSYGASLGYYQTGSSAPFAGVLQALDGGAGARLLLNPSGGNVGIGTTSPGSLLNLAHPTVSDIRLTVASTLVGNIYGSSSDLNVHAVANVPLTFATNNTERARIDSSGRLLVGTSSSRDKWFNSAAWGNPTFQLETNVSVTSVASIVNNANDDGPGALFLAKSRAGSVGGVTVVSNNDIVGRIAFQGADGTEMVAAAMIEAQIDGTPGANDMPGRLVFSTTADGAASSTERFRIGSAGQLGIGGATYGTSGQVLTSGGASAAPSWQAPGGAGTLKAWVNFDGTGTVAIRASGNVSSITDNATGVYTVNYTTALPDQSGAPIAFCSDDGISNRAMNMQSTNTTFNLATSCRINIWGGGTSPDSSGVYFAIFR